LDLTFKIAINIVGVILILNKGTINENSGNAYLPELPNDRS